MELIVIVKCPYLACQEEFEIVSAPFVNCPNCKKPILICKNEKCQNGNRTFARFCISCGKKISFLDSYTTHLENTRIRTRFRQNDLDYLQIVNNGKIRVSRVIHRNGFLIILTQGSGIYVFNGNLPKNGFQHQLAEDISATFIDLNSCNRNLLFSNQNDIFELKLDSVPKLNKMFSTEGTIVRDFISLNNHFFFIEKHDNQTYFKVYREKALINSYDIENDVSTLLLVKNEQIFFYSASFLYSFTENQFEKIPVPGQCKLDVSGNHLSFENSIFISGLDKPYRVVNTPQNYTLTPFIHDNFGSPHFLTLNDQGNELIIAHGRGLSVYHKITGQFLWDTMGDYYIPPNNPCNRFPTKIVGNYIMFVHSPGDGAVVGFVPITTHNDACQTFSVKSLAFAPEVIFDNLFLIVKEQQNNKIMYLSLCES